MRITHVIPYMHPAAGGPPVVVDRLSRELAARGHHVRVLTTDFFSQGQTAWQADEAQPYELAVFPTRSGYCYGSQFRSAIRSGVRESDVVHVHTLWTFASLAAALPASPRRCRSL